MEPRWFDTAADAIEYATSEYWVDPIQVSDDKEASSFADCLIVCDWSESGLVHFERR